MTKATETSGKYDFGTDPDGFTEDDIRAPDLYLDWLLRALFGDDNSIEASTQMTLVLDGAVVSGVVISGKEWKRRMAESLTSANAKLSAAFTTFSDRVFAVGQDVVASRTSAGRPLAAFQYIYMRNVRVSTGVSEQVIPLWRARISKVSGWSIGSTNTLEEVKGE